MCKTERTNKNIFNANFQIKKKKQLISITKIVKISDIGSYTEDCCSFIVDRIKKSKFYKNLRIKHFFFFHVFQLGHIAVIPF